MRILHLVKPPGAAALDSGRFDDGTDASLLACGEAIEFARQQFPGLRHEVFVFGSTAQGLRAERAGLEVAGRLTPPAGVLGFTRFGLRAVLMDRTDIGAVQCWSESLVPVAQASAPARVRVLPPPWDLSLRATGSGENRDGLRTAIGVSPDDFCVLLLADPPATGDVRSFAFVLGLFEVAGHITVGIVPRGVRSWSRARRFVKASDLRCRLALADLPAVALAAACDVAIAHAEPEVFDGAVLPRHTERLAAERAAVLSCHARSVPVVSVRNRGLDDLYAGLPELLTDSDHANHIGRAVLTLKDDPALLADLRSRVRSAVMPRDRFEVTNLWVPAGKPTVARTGIIAG